MKHDTTKNVQCKHKDLPGQMDLNGNYIKPPDDACALNAKPLEKPTPPPRPKFKLKRRIFNMFAGGGEVYVGSPNQFNEVEI